MKTSPDPPTAEHELRARKIFEKYLRLAQNLDQTLRAETLEVGKQASLAGLILFTLFGGAVSLGYKTGPAAWLIFSFLSAIAVLYLGWVVSLSRNHVRRTREETTRLTRFNPRFDEFYRFWRRAKNRAGPEEKLPFAGELAAIALSAAAGQTDETEKGPH